MPNCYNGFSDTYDKACIIGVLEELPTADVVEVVRCAHCAYWDRETMQYQANDFRSWNEAECKILAERDPYHEINRYTEADDYCSYGERKDG